MPELPEVETIKRDLEKRIVKEVLSEIMIHNPLFLQKNKITPQDLFSLKGQLISSVERRGKYLLLNYEKKCLIFHLGLTGSLILKKNLESPLKVTKHCLFTLFFKTYSLTFRDIRKFGKIFLLERYKIDFFFKSLGEDALTISYENFFKLLSQHKGNLKAFFLNQKYLAGLGNIYTDELLFRTKISPFRKTTELTLDEVKLLYHNLKNLLQEAINLRGSSVKDYIDGLGHPGKFQEKHLVYRKAGHPCPNCGNLLKYVKIHQRGTTFCPYCQK